MPDAYSLAMVDLNGDGRKEAIVRFTGSHICGTGGCTTLVLTRGLHGWRILSTITIVQLPIRLLATRSRGWRDVGVFVVGGGILPGYDAVLRFNGRTYPGNPSVAPAVRRARAGGTVLIGRNDRGFSLARHCR